MLPAIALGEAIARPGLVAVTLAGARSPASRQEAATSSMLPRTARSPSKKRPRGFVSFDRWIRPRSATNRDSRMRSRFTPLGTLLLASSCSSGWLIHQPRRALLEPRTPAPATICPAASATTWFFAEEPRLRTPDGYGLVPPTCLRPAHVLDEQPSTSSQPSSSRRVQTHEISRIPSSIRLSSESRTDRFPATTTGGGSARSA